VSPTCGLVFTLLLYLTIGPLFAMPRTATVSFEIGVVPFMAPGVSQTVPLALFSLFFFALSCWLALSPGKLVSRIGKVLTPLLLFCIAILVGAAALFPSGALQAAHAGGGRGPGSGSRGAPGPSRTGRGTAAAGAAAAGDGGVGRCRQAPGRRTPAG